MSLIRTIRRYLDGKLNSRRAEEDGDQLNSRRAEEDGDELNFRRAEEDSDQLNSRRAEEDGDKLNSRRAVEDGQDVGIAFETSDLFFSLRTLQEATNFFSQSNLLGEGGFCRVYKGLMPNGQEIAVKRLDLSGRHRAAEFTNEVKLLSEMRHMNLVTLLGSCAEGCEKMLVYEYLSNRSLDYLLFDKEKSSSLDWATRFRIVTGVARGLLYLHEEAPMRILHGDINASHILLDEKLSPKISNFGVALLFPEEDTRIEVSRPAGTYAYMAPEYLMHGYLSVKTDVFSYGILLLEIISGRRNLYPKLAPDHAWKLYEAGETLELVDPSLDSFYNADEVGMCIQIALLCCQESAAYRPDMNSIHVMLSSDWFTLSLMKVGNIIIVRDHSRYS